MEWTGSIVKYSNSLRSGPGHAATLEILSSTPIEAKLIGDGEFESGSWATQVFVGIPKTGVNPEGILTLSVIVYG